MNKKENPDNSKIDKEDKRGYSSDEEIDVLDIDEESDKVAAKLKQKLKECQKDKKEFLDGWQRSKAELINTRKQDIEQNKKAFLRIQEDFIFQLLPVIDSFDMAFTDTEEMKKSDSNWKMGIQNIHSQFKDFMKSVGVKTIDQIGETFDPKKHDSVETISTDNKEEDGLVVQVLQKGYILEGNIIRAARVRVAKFEA